jgi:hypothetical protein
LQKSPSENTEGLFVFREEIGNTLKVFLEGSLIRYYCTIIKNS